MARRAAPAGVARIEPEPHAGHAGIGPVVRLEHQGEGLGAQDPAVVVGAPAEQRRGVAGHVPGRGVQRAAAGGDDVEVLDRVQTATAELVAGRQAGSDAF
nr:hypothetical protein DA06_16795 [Georgenia sp. SUBG003]